MARYIDADKLVIETQSLEDIGQGIMQFYSKEQIEDAPTADVQPVIHAKWIDESEDSLKCSNCKLWIYKPFIGGSNERTKHYSPQYCAFCGAKMDLKENKDGKV